MPVRERVITGLRVALAVVSAGSVRLGASGSGRTARWTRLRRICPAGVCTRYDRGASV